MGYYREKVNSLGSSDEERSAFGLGGSYVLGLLLLESVVLEAFFGYFFDL